MSGSRSKAASAYRNSMETGALVPDKVLFALISDRLRMLDCATQVRGLRRVRHILCTVHRACLRGVGGLSIGVKYIYIYIYIYIYVYMTQ